MKKCEQKPIPAYWIYYRRTYVRQYMGEENEFPPPLRGKKIARNFHVLLRFRRNHGKARVA